MLRGNTYALIVIDKGFSSGGMMEIDVDEICMLYQNLFV